VKLGPTEHRVAAYLADATRHGWIRIRTAELAERLGLERSEAYRVLARLRVLGLFGIQDDRGGARGGRMVWRTPTVHDGPGLDPVRHRLAWARIRGWARARVGRVLSITRAPVPPSGPAHLSAGGVERAAGALGFAQLVAPALGAWFTDRSVHRGPA
jgi:DNA-binding IclR family transcriptional regulator